VSSQFTIFLSALAQAEQKLAKALRALLYAAAKVMKSTHTNQTLWARVGDEIELGFLTQGNLSFNSFHA
jgi:HEPN domain-containing protein